MPRSRKARLGRRRQRTAEPPPNSPPAGASRITESPPAPWRWATLPAWSRHHAAAGFALCAIIAVSFYPALSAGFVWDDEIFAKAPEVHAWSGLWHIWFSPAEIEQEGHYWPILYTTFWLEHKLWGLEPFGYHLVNVLLYMASRAVVVASVAASLRARRRRLGGGRGIRGPSHACRVGGLGYRAQGSAFRNLLHGMQRYAG